MRSDPDVLLAVTVSLSESIAGLASPFHDVARRDRLYRGKQHDVYGDLGARHVQRRVCVRVCALRDIPHGIGQGHRAEPPFAGTAYEDD